MRPHDADALLRIRVAPGMGRGVFASKTLRRGTRLASTVTWELTPRDIELIDQTSIAGHWFTNPERPRYGLLALGLLSLINHSYGPNAVVKWRKSKLGWIADIIATRTIRPGAQIFIDYGLPPEQLGFLTTSAEQIKPNP